MNDITEKREHLMEIGKHLGQEYTEMIEGLDDANVEELFNEHQDLMDCLPEMAEESRSESSKKLLELPSNRPVVMMPPKEFVDSINESKELLEGKMIPATVTVDPITGTHAIDPNIHEDLHVSDVTISDIIDGKELNPSDLKDTFKYSLGDDITEAEVLEIIAFVNRVQKEKPKYLYPLLPNVIKRAIDETIPKNADIRAREFAAFQFYDMIKKEIIIDKQFIELEETIKKELNVPSITDMYMDHIKDVMEVKMLEKADELSESNPEKAETLRAISRAFTDSYEFTTIKSKINNKAGRLNRELNKELKDYHHHCKKFNAMYKPSKFIITDIRKLAFILDRKLPEDISMDSIKKFVMLLCKVFRNMDPENIVQHTLMYYTCRLIESLDHIDATKTEFTNKLINNISEVIRSIEQN